MRSNAATFYQAGAQALFALLGLWWVVCQFRHALWMGDPAMRRHAHVIAMHFLLLGTMCLVGILGADEPTVWRAGFALAGALGAIAAAALLAVRAAGVQGLGTNVTRAASAAMLAAYVLVVLVAVVEQILVDVGIALTPLQAEAILVTLVMFASVNLAWTLFTAPQAAPR